MEKKRTFVTHKKPISVLPMKKILLLAGAAVLMASCGEKKAVLTAELSGMQANDTVLVSYKGQADTLAAPNGVFTYEFTDSVPGIVSFFQLPKRNPDGSMQAFRMRPISVMMQPNTPVTVKGTFDEYEVTGSDFYKELNSIAVLKETQKKQESLQKRFVALQESGKLNEDSMTVIRQEYAIADSINQAGIKEYVTAHPESEVSLFLLYYYRPECGTELYDKFTDQVKNGAFKEMYKEVATRYESIIAKQKAAEFIKEGKPAPDFTLKTLDGKDFTLSSLKGKYVVLDFWGSWCGWCIKGMPEMKKMYAKYKDKLEVVGIDCGDTEEKWKKAVAENELPWTNVINNTEEGKDLTVIYNISGFPTKLVIDPEGNIAKIVVGEDPAFYEAIDGFMK